MISQTKRDKIRTYLIDIMTDGPIGQTMNDITLSLRKRKISVTLILAVIYGALARLAYETFDCDAMILRFFIERTRLCLDQFSDPKQAIKEIKEFIASLEKSGHPIPRLMKRCVKRNSISWSNCLLDKVTLEEVKEIMDLRAVDWLASTLYLKGR